MFKSRILVITASLTTVLLFCTIAASLQQQGKNASGDLSLEIASVNGQPTYSQIPNSGEITILVFRFEKVAEWERPGSQSSDPSAIKLKCKREVDSVRIAISVLLGEFDKQDTPHSLKGVPENDVAVSFAKQGETISLRELLQFGIMPFDIRVVSAKPPAATPPQIINRTKAIEVVGVEEFRQRCHMSLRNVSSKDIMALYIYVPSPDGQSAHAVEGTRKRPVIAAGNFYETDIEVSRPGRITPQGFVPNSVEQQTIVIGTVVFDDGTFEGEAEVAAEIEARQRGRRMQLSRVVTLLQSVLEATEQDTNIVLEKLRTQVSALSEDADAKVADELMSRYATLSDESKGMITLGLMRGLNEGKQTMLFEIKEFQRARETTDGNASYRVWLSRIKAQYKKMIAEP